MSSWFPNNNKKNYPGLMARYFQKTLIPFGGEIPTLSAFQHAVCCGSMM